MEKGKVRDILSWVLLGFIPMLILVDGWLLLFVVPSKIAICKDFEILLSAPMLFAIAASNFFTNLINLLILSPVMLLAAAGLVLKECLVKPPGIRIGINLGVLLILLVFTGVLVFGLIATMVGLNERLSG